MSDCQRCSRPVLDAAVCSTCGRDLERALAVVGFLEPELELTLSKQTRFGAGSEGRGGDRSLPVNLLALEASGHLRAILVGWCRLYAEEAHDDLDTLDDTLVAMSRYLLTRVEWLRHHDAALDVVDEVTSAVRRCRVVIDAPANRTTFVVGPCPETDNAGLPCAGMVRAFIPTSDGEPARMTCRTCQSTYATWQWLRAGKRILDRRDEMRRVG